MEEYKIKNITFSKRPISIPADYRPVYKIALIVLILKLTCRNESSKLLKLHLMSWALKSGNNQQQLLSLIISNFNTEFAVWGIEPSLNRAMQIAVAEKICKYEKGNYVLAEKGNLFFEKINDDKDLFHTEKSFLKQIGKNKITEKRLASLSNKWKIFNVKN